MRAATGLKTSNDIIALKGLPGRLYMRSKYGIHAEQRVNLNQKGLMVRNIPRKQCLHETTLECGMERICPQVFAWPRAQSYL